jgi:hypothetical protein
MVIATIERFWHLGGHGGLTDMEAEMPNFEVELRSALKQNDFSRINYLRETGLEMLSRNRGLLSLEGLDYLARACRKCRIPWDYAQ